MKKLFIVPALLFALCTAGSSMAKQNSQLDGVVNVNTASVSELMLLPGVGEAKANSLVKTRQLKPYAKKADLLLVKGIGEKIVASWGNHIAFSGKTTLKQK